MLTPTNWVYVYAEVDLATNHASFFLTDFSSIDSYSIRTVQTTFLGGLSTDTTIILGSWTQGPFNPACGDFRDVTFVWVSLKEHPLSLYAFLYDSNVFLPDFQKSDNNFSQ